MSAARAYDQAFEIEIDFDDDTVEVEAHDILDEVEAPRTSGVFRAARVEHVTFKSLLWK